LPGYLTLLDSEKKSEITKFRHSYFGPTPLFISATTLDHTRNSHPIMMVLVGWSWLTAKFICGLGVVVKPLKLKKCQKIKQNKATRNVCKIFI